MSPHLCAGDFHHVCRVPSLELLGKSRRLLLRGRRCLCLTRDLLPSEVQHGECREEPRGERFPSVRVRVPIWFENHAPPRLRVARAEFPAVPRPKSGFDIGPRFGSPFPTIDSRAEKRAVDHALLKQAAQNAPDELQTEASSRSFLRTLIRAPVSTQQGAAPTPMRRPSRRTARAVRTLLRWPVSTPPAACSKWASPPPGSPEARRSTGCTRGLRASERGQGRGSRISEYTGSSRR